MLFLTKLAKRDFLNTCARITKGSLRLQTPEGEVHDFGAGNPTCEMQIHDWSVVTSIAARGDIGLGDEIAGDQRTQGDDIEIGNVVTDH